MAEGRSVKKRGGEERSGARSCSVRVAQALEKHR